MTTLADLLVRAHLYRACFPDSAFHSMSKAVRRVAEAAGSPPHEHGATDVLAEHAALAGKLDIGAKQFAEEQANLARLVVLPGLPGEISRRIYAGKATIEDALAVVALQDDPRSWEQVAMALRSFARHLQEGVATVVGGRRLDSLLDRHRHLDVGLQKSTWVMRKSLIRRGVRLVDMETKQSLKTTMLSGAWRELIEAANPGRGQKGTRTSRRGMGHHIAKVWPLVAYCWREGIGPHGVNDSVVQRFLVDLEEQKGGRALDKARAAIYAWEWLQVSSISWPQQKLSRLYRSRATSSPHQLQFEDLPAELQDSWHAYVGLAFESDGPAGPLANLVMEPDADVEDDDEDSYKPLIADNATDEDGVPTILRSRNTLPDFYCTFLYAANAAIKGLGMAPRTVSELLTPDVLNLVLDRRHNRQKRRAREKNKDLVPTMKNLTLKHTVAVFKGMASDLGVDERLIAGIDNFYDRVHPHIIGRDRNTGERIFASNKMGPRHQEMLRQFGENGGQEKLLAWFQLPEKLFNKVHEKYERAGAKGLSEEEICDLITAVVGGIIRSCPLRRANLGQLRIGIDREKNIGPNLYLPNHSQKVGRIYLLANEIKKGRDDFGVWLTPSATRHLKFYVEKVRREVMRRRGSDPDNPYLFPSYGMKHRPLGLITKHWVKRCKQAGFELDLHANRHLTATIILQRDVNAMALVQKILGHKNLRTTEDYYAEVKDYLVQAEFQTHLEEAEHALSLDLLVALKGVKK